MDFRRREARRITPPQQMDSAVVKAAEAILQDKDSEAIERVHNQNALEKLIDETAALAENLEGEAKLRCLMSVRCLLDTQESFHIEEIEE